MHLLLIALAAAYGSVCGLLVPRAVFRLAVEPEERWRARCPAGHEITGPARGWLGPARCRECAGDVLPAEVATAGATLPAEVGPSAPGEKEPPPSDAGGPGASALGAVPLDPSAPGAEAPHASAAGEAPAAADNPWPPRPGGRYGPAGALTAAAASLVCGGLAATTGARPELALWLLLVPFLGVLTLVDLAVHRLPDVLTLPLPAAAIALLGAAALLPGNAGSWTGAVLGGLGLGAAYLVLFLIHPRGMGFGDVKLALTLGVALGWYGWPLLFAGAFAGFLFGALYGAGLLLTRRASRKTALPFGPFMIAGTLLGLMLGGLGAA
ncbi:A24 family peptidase [Streptomyces sp. NPDC051776]|uniref:A24 family peptidase n=1 Tax=Streptomyces sp. NPDC051776 TaxID=3155414 RepID=UPI00341A97D9